MRNSRIYSYLSGSRNEKVARRLITRRSLAIHEFAGLAKVPDVNNLISLQLSGPDIFSINCVADIYSTDPNDSVKYAHTNFVPTEKRWPTTNEFIGYEFMGKLAGIYISIIFAVDDSNSTSRYTETEITYWENYLENPGFTSNFISHGWGGQIWTATSSARYPEKKINIRCHDKSIVDPDQKFLPDYDYLSAQN